MTLRISPDLSLPDSFATQGVVVMGVRGSGKSNTEARFAELLYKAKIPFVVVDPKGDWWGIRSSADGSGPGLAVPVFGGLHGDFPLDASLGARIADLLVDENLSAVLDVSKLAKTGARATFLVVFFNQLMERHQNEPHVRCVILEEAHSYIPQQVKGSAAALKEAAASVLLEGRSFGLGCWACTQRPARLHNDVLEECDTAVIHRIGVAATADLKRVRDWVKHEDLSDDISTSLTKLAAGEAWVLAPVSLGIVKRIQVDRRTTFDSGATPTVGVSRRAMSTMADIDIPAVTEALAAAIEKAKADDPRELRRHIAELQAALTEMKPAEDPELRAAYDENLALLRDRTAQMDGVLTVLATVRGAMTDVAEALAKALNESDIYQELVRTPPREVLQKVPDRPVRSAPSRGAGPPPAPSRPVRATPSDGELKGGELKLLTAAAQYPGGVTREQLTVLVGYKRSSRDTYLQRLRSRGFILSDSRWVYPTADGVAALGPNFEPLPTGAALRQHWLTTLGEGGEGQILALLINAYPNSVDKDTLSERTGYKRSSRDTYLQRLRSRQLVTTESGSARASDVLFDG